MIDTYATQLQSVFSGESRLGIPSRVYSFLIDCMIISAWWLLFWINSKITVHLLAAPVALPFSFLVLFPFRFRFCFCFYCSRSLVNLHVYMRILHAFAKQQILRNEFNIATVLFLLLHLLLQLPIFIGTTRTNMQAIVKCGRRCWCRVLHAACCCLQLFGQSPKFCRLFKSSFGSTKLASPACPASVLSI